MRQQKMMRQKKEPTQEIRIKQSPQTQKKKVKPRLIEERIVENVESQDDQHQNSRFKNDSFNLDMEEDESQSYFDANSSSIVESRVEVENSKINQINSNLSNLSASVSNLKDEYRELQKSEVQLLIDSKKGKSSAISKAQIKQFLRKKKIEKKIFENKMKKDLSRSEKTRLEALRKPEIDKEQMKKKKQQELRRANSDLSSKIAVKKVDMKNQQGKVKQIYDKYLSKAPLFEIKEKQFNQKIKDEEEKTKEFLLKRKQFFKKPIDLQKIEEHKQWHDETVAKLNKERSDKKLAVLDKIVQGNENLKNLYHSKGAQELARQENQRQEKKKVPYLVRSKIQEYTEHVKQNYLPQLKSKSKSKGSLEKSRSNSGGSLQMRKVARPNRSNLSLREVKRYRYMKGVFYGQVTEQLPEPKSLKQRRLAGMKNLQYAKSHRKKESLGPHDSYSVEIPKRTSDSPQNPLKHQRKRKPVVSLKSEPTREEINMVLMQLRNNDKKIRDKQKIENSSRVVHQKFGTARHEINNDLLYNVQRKLNLLHKLEDDKSTNTRDQGTEYNYYEGGKGYSRRSKFGYI